MRFLPPIASSTGLRTTQGRWLEPRRLARAGLRWGPDHPCGEFLRSGLSSIPRVAAECTELPTQTRGKGKCLLGSRWINGRPPRLTEAVLYTVTIIEWRNPFVSCEAGGLPSKVVSRACRSPKNHCAR